MTGRPLRLDATGLLEDPRGLHVVMERDNRQMIGDVMGWEHREVGVVLLVQHFDGSWWPFDPLARDVLALERTP